MLKHKLPGHEIDLFKFWTTLFLSKDRDPESVTVGVTLLSVEQIFSYSW